ncbi:MAG: sugar transferase [Sedimentisphaerales bacterium]|nr:sugar transferase [Sedimentisphaerales bacterium]
MNLVIIRENEKPSASNGGGLLRFCVSSEPLAGIVLGGLSRSSLRVYGSITPRGRLAGAEAARPICAVPGSWGVTPGKIQSVEIVSYEKKTPLDSAALYKAGSDPWCVITNGRFATQFNDELLGKILAGINADVVAVNAESELRAAHEKVRLTVQGNVAGFRRLYNDSAEPVSFPVDWPHHLFIRGCILERCLDEGALPESFAAVLEKCRSNDLKARSIKVAGSSLDLDTEEGIFALCEAELSLSTARSCMQSAGNADDSQRQKARLIGEVLLGKNVRIDSDVIIVGPSIVCDNVRIERGAVIDSSIIGPEVRIGQDQVVRNSVVAGPHYRIEDKTTFGKYASKPIHNRGRFERRSPGDEVFRKWSMFSYAGCFKRIVDIVFSIIVLILFAPIMPFVALAVKLTSPGPVFYKDKRQGRYGVAFNCLKFRTMSIGSDRIQEKLRIVSRVDGPQFKMEDDPRITKVGKFLRDTYIDEIPQFFNVLWGQMSVVGPRPSPESENTLCPSWRDARLSVRPGITGLWQVRRTRKSGQDFQEWIYYDTRYVRHLSLRIDCEICRQTIKKMIKSFIEQF